MRGDRLKKAFPVLPLFIFLCYCFLPLCILIGWISDYSFTLSSYPVCSVVLAVVSIIATVLLFAFKTTLNKINVVFSALLLPMSIITGTCYSNSSNVNGITWKPIGIFILICCACSAIVFFKFAGPFALKIVSGVLSAILVLLMVFTVYINLIFAGFGADTVVKSVSSPQNTYVAEVIDADQGALGGNTLVDVYHNYKTIDLLFCRFTKNPLLVYEGEDGAYENMKINWKNEHTLSINEKEYQIH